MSKTDEEIVREVLVFREPGVRIHSDEATQALDRLMSRTVPELPPGWTWHRIGQAVTKGKGVYRAHASKIEERERPYDKKARVRTAVASGEGPTIRAACNAAIEKIGEQKS